MRVLHSLFVISACILCACDKAPRSAAAPSPPPAVELTLALKGGRSGGPLGAKLDYEVHTPHAVLPMRLADRKQPEGALVELEHATLKVKPFLCPPKLDRPRRRCTAEGCFTLCVRDARGIHVGDFEVNNLGALVFKPDTHDEGNLYLERITTVDRTVYFAYDLAPGGGRGDIVLGLEYRPTDNRRRVAVSGDDGWDYSFGSPDGRLIVYRPEGIGGLPDQLARQAEEQTLAGRYADDLARKQRDWALGRAAGRSAGGSCLTGGG